jgi:hypothetical protein
MKARSDPQREFLELEALSFIEGAPEVRDVFLQLTGQGALHLRTDPTAESLKWDGGKIPGDADLTLDAAVRFLIGFGYVGEIIRLGASDYVVTASQKAKEVRSVYDRLPERTEAPRSPSSDSAR